MNPHTTTPRLLVRLVRATGRARTRLWPLLGTSVAFFALFVSTAAALDMLPEAGATQAAAPVIAVSAVTPTELPTEIRIPSLDRVVPVDNPVSTDVAALDKALLTATVRYPTSAKLGAEGNVIIFGHSSHLPIVRNQLFKAFNDIETLEKGDEIVVKGSRHEYVYAVETVTEADANLDAIPLTVDGKRLTLATCDSFGSTAGRFIVTAGLVGVREVQE
jgi:LPXTG-site transpeptidase (sortase) family protein